MPENVFEFLLAAVVLTLLLWIFWWKGKSD